ncbi:putative endopeptidase Clp [Helianthus anomalus]
MAKHYVPYNKAGRITTLNVSKLRSNQKIVRTYSVNVVYSGDYPSLDKNSRQGMWSISGSRVLSVNSFNMWRIIRCGGAVDDDMGNIIVAQLLYLHVVDPNKV